jgi:hypothetical protein
MNGKYKIADKLQSKLLAIISNVRDGKSIERYLQDQWMQLYHNDPAGVLFIQYKTTGDELEVYPTYQSIGSIRTYIPKGQLVDNILFEPIKLPEGKLSWTLIDDAKQYAIIQNGDTFTISQDEYKTFKHPFGTCPIIINSNIIDKYGNRKSPIDIIIPAAKKYAHNLSVAEIYETLQGFPKHWRRAMVCKSCHGNKKVGTETCKDCSGKGEYGKGDVTDQVIIPMPENGDPVLTGDDIMGFSQPDLETMKALFDRLNDLEDKAYETLWGTAPMKKISKTATEIHYDTQPQINKLNSYADTAEWVEWMITEWLANAIDTTKEKDQSISLIVYGRRYILEGIDTIQEKYESAKKNGENNVVLDGIFDELLIVKFKNDPECMKIELKKDQCEPYLHQSVMEVNTIFGAQEAARKIYFQRWWRGLSDSDLQSDVIKLQDKFDIDFEVYLPKVKITKPISPSLVPSLDPAKTD